MLDLTESAHLYQYEERSDSIIEEADLVRLEKEINHNLKKQAHERKNRNELPEVRVADD